MKILKQKNTRYAKQLKFPKLENFKLDGFLGEASWHLGP